MVSPKEATCVRILHHTALLIALVDPLWLDDLLFWVGQVLVQSVDLSNYVDVSKNMSGIVQNNTTYCLY